MIILTQDAMTDARVINHVINDLHYLRSEG